MAGAPPWRELREGFVSLHQVDRCAFIADEPSMRAAARLAGALVPCDLQSYAISEAPRALEWLTTRDPEEASAPSVRILPKECLLLVEMRGRLNADDLDAVSRVAATWTVSGGPLRSIVLHGSRFPGWEDPKTVLGYWEIIGDQFPRIRRFAVAVGGPLASLFADAGGEFTSAEIRRFGPTRLYEAIAWAAAAVNPSDLEPIGQRRALVRATG
jgi:hypothetical protein